MAGKTRKKLDVSAMAPDRVRSIAERYVTDHDNYTIADLCKIYGLTEHYFREVIKRAITEALVSYKMCEAIRDKSSGNQRRHLWEEKPSAVDYYMVLFDKRFEFLRHHENYEKTKAYAKNYLSTRTTIGQMADSCGLSSREMFYFIVKGAVCYFNQREFDMFIRKIKTQFAHDRFIEVKLEKIESYRAQINELRNQIEIDDQKLAHINESLSSEDEEAGRIESLEKHRADLANQLEDFIREPLY